MWLSVATYTQQKLRQWEQEPVSIYINFKHDKNEVAQQLCRATPSRIGGVCEHNCIQIQDSMQW
eukprot:6201024-Pleurochrysis_carterae.AAC.2